MSIEQYEARIYNNIKKVYGDYIAKVFISTANGTEKRQLLETVDDNKQKITENINKLYYDDVNVATAIINTSFGYSNKKELRLISDSVELSNREYRRLNEELDLYKKKISESEMIKNKMERNIDFIIEFVGRKYKYLGNDRIECGLCKGIILYGSDIRCVRCEHCTFHSKCIIRFMANSERIAENICPGCQMGLSYTSEDAIS